MDSLVASYASSDDDEEEQNSVASPSKLIQSSSSSSSSSILKASSLPRPKSSSLFSSLPQPKQSSQNPSYSSSPSTQSDEAKDNYEDEGPKSTFKSSSIFSSLPLPKSEDPQQPTSNSSSSKSTTKRVVKFTPPVNVSSVKSSEFDEDDDEDDHEKEKKKRNESFSVGQISSVKSFLSSIPAPRKSTTLGVLPSSGLGRRSIIETEVSESVNLPNADQIVEQNLNYEVGADQNAGNYVHHESFGDYQSGFYQNVYNNDASAYSTYENSGNCVNYGNYEQYENNFTDGSVIMPPEAASIGSSAVRVPGKRARNEIPTEIVEVKQDELIKNRPREDQVKLTGIAFGPSYQPVSTKGKPSKLHKRKHQIGSLYFDMKQKEMELAERRSRGFLTKAETHAKYGW